jgi:prophage antirepressor-like protein
MNELQVRDGVSKRYPISTEPMAFSFEGHQVCTVMADGTPWFVGRDVCNALGIKNVSRALQTRRIDSKGREYLNFPENEKADIPLTYISSNGTRQARKTLCVNEPGLYRLIFQSHKPEAERLKALVFNEVLPQIRKTGKYNAAESRLGILEEKVDSLLEEKGVRDELDRCKRSKKRATPKDCEEIRELHKAGYTKKAIAGITYRGRTVINNALREAVNQPGLFDDEPSESFGGPLEAPRGYGGGAV